MRIWHKDLVSVLPRQQLLGQWRELCLIAKNISENDTPNHVLVNRVMEYPREHLSTYAANVCLEMARRGYYRIDISRFLKWCPETNKWVEQEELFSGWHNDRYLRQCLYNLQEKADCGAITAEEWKRITETYPEFQ